MTQCCRESEGSVTHSRLLGLRPTEKSLESSGKTEPFSGPSLATSLGIIAPPEQQNNYTAKAGFSASATQTDGIVRLSDRIEANTSRCRVCIPLEYPLQRFTKRIALGSAIANR